MTSMQVVLWRGLRTIKPTIRKKGRDQFTPALARSEKVRVIEHRGRGIWMMARKDAMACVP